MILMGKVGHSGGEELGKDKSQHGEVSRHMCGPDVTHQQLLSDWWTPPPPHVRGTCPSVLGPGRAGADDPSFASLA